MEETKTYCKIFWGLQSLAAPYWSTKWQVWTAECETCLNDKEQWLHHAFWFVSPFFCFWSLLVVHMCQTGKTANSCMVCPALSLALFQESHGYTNLGHKRKTHHCVIWDHTESTWVTSNCLSKDSRAFWLHLDTGRVERFEIWFLICRFDFLPLDVFGLVSEEIVKRRNQALGVGSLEKYRPSHVSTWKTMEKDGKGVQRYFWILLECFG